MRNTIEFVWKAIKSECEKFQNEDPTIKFNDQKHDAFKNLFTDYYDNIMDRFMRDTTELDSHKQAAIITISCLESNIVEHKVESDQISIVPQLIAINVGLSYMNDRLNEVLSKKHIRQIDQYDLPIAIACDTPYIEIMSRMLYYEQHEEDISFNILELADRYFLLEYINLIQQGIEPDLLKQ